MNTNVAPGAPVGRVARDILQLFGYYIFVEYLILLQAQAGTAGARIRASVQGGSCQPGIPLVSFQGVGVCGRVGFARELAFAHPPALHTPTPLHFTRYMPGCHSFSALASHPHTTHPRARPSLQLWGGMWLRHPPHFCAWRYICSVGVYICIVLVYICVVTYVFTLHMCITFVYRQLCKANWKIKLKKYG